MLRLAFTPKWLGSLVLALGLASIFVLLSQWQIGRAQERDEVIGNTETERVKEFNDVMTAGEALPSTTINQRVQVSGSFLPEMQTIVPGRLLDGAEGYWVVTMFVPDDARAAAAELPATSGNPAPQTVDEDAPIAIPVVRGWAPTAEEARASTVSGEPFSFEGRIGPIEAPTPSEGLAADEATTVSSAELVNRWDVRSYSGILFPEVSAGTATGLSAFDPPTFEEEEGLNWQSVFYAVEWIVFAAFAMYIWWRLLRDDYLRRQQTGSENVTYAVVKEAGEKYRDE